jgi:hypothetical protein
LKPGFFQSDQQRKRIEALKTERENLQRQRAEWDAELTRLETENDLPGKVAALEQLRRSADEARGRFDDAAADVDRLVPLFEDPRNGATARLFRSAAEVNANYANLFPAPAAGPPRVPPLVERHPPVEPNSGTLSTLRRLADAARKARGEGEVHDANSAWRVAASNARLFKAARTLEGHMLLLSYNRHAGEENTVRLRGELGEHALHMDALESRVKEASFRLTLGDIRAYHGTGITDNDLRAIQSFILLGIAFD